MKSESESEREREGERERERGGGGGERNRQKQRSLTAVENSIEKPKRSNISTINTDFYLFN